MKCCVYARFHYENIFLDYFIQHYIELGFDLILILYHDIKEYEIPECYKEKVVLINVPNYGNYLPDMFRNNIPKDIDWVLNVDSDEYLYIHQKFPTIKHFIKDKLEYEPTINVFSFLWGWCHNIEPIHLLTQTLNSLVSNSNIYVGNRIYQNNTLHEKKGNEIWIKSMFRLNLVKDLAIHMPILKEPYVIYTIKNEVIKYNNMTHRIKTLNYHEKFWESGFYEESCLIHLATRDIHNLIFKSYNIHSSQMKKKNIKDKENFENGIKNIDFKSAAELYLHFQKNIGYKFEIPFKCVKFGEKANFKIENYNPKMQSNSSVIASSDYSYYYEFNIFRNLFNNTDYMLAINMLIEEYNKLFIQ